MSNQQKARRFRINPVEIAIFAIVSLIFSKSVYDLFQDRGNFRFAALSPMSSQPTSAARNPASVSPDFLNLDLSCGEMGDQQTSAGKLRLTGALCKKGDHPVRLLKTQISNQANRYAATVFTDMTAKKFSTDYIPLLPGKNPIQVEFVWQNNKFIQQFNIFNVSTDLKAEF